MSLLHTQPSARRALPGASADAAGAPRHAAALPTPSRPRASVAISALAVAGCAAALPLLPLLGGPAPAPITAVPAPVASADPLVASVPEPSQTPSVPARASAAATAATAAVAPAAPAATAAPKRAITTPAAQPAPSATRDAASTAVRTAAKATSQAPAPARITTTAAPKPAAPTTTATTAAAPAPAASSAASRAVAYALARLGHPYQVGAMGPTYYDCSGLVAAAWQSAGVSAPHSMTGLAAMGSYVPASQLRPGDVVIWGDPITAVSLYVGNDTIVIAEPGSGVHTVSLSARMGYKTFAGGRRIG